MKKSDIISVVLVAMIGTFAAAFIVNLIMGNPDDAKASFKDIEVVDSSLSDPDPEVFNSDAINPTIEVYVGSCVDVDQDGSLSQAELMACGRIDGIDEEDEEDDDSSSSSSSGFSSPSSSEDGETIVEETIIDEYEGNGTSNSRHSR